MSVRLCSGDFVSLCLGCSVVWLVAVGAASWLGAGHALSEVLLAGVVVGILRCRVMFCVVGSYG